MGCYRESEPAFDEEYGLDLVPVNTLGREGEIDRTLNLLGKDVEESKEQTGDKKTVITNPHEQILQLYDEFRPKLLQYLHKMYLKRDVAEEVIQETFLRLTTELMQPNSIVNVQGWIVRVAHNLAVDVIRKSEKDVARMADFNSAELETFIDPGVGPDEALRSKEQSSRIKAALSTVTAHQRLCFNLRIQGFRYKDIGHALGISEQRAAIVVKRVAVRVAALCQWERTS